MVPESVERILVNTVGWLGVAAAIALIAAIVAGLI